MRISFAALGNSMASGVTTKRYDEMAEADRALDDAKSKAVCIQKRAQAALALAESIAKGRRLIDTFGG